MKVHIMFLLILGLIAGCTNLSIKVKEDSTYAFERAETYCWIPAPSKILSQKDTFVHEAVQKILDENWASMGLTKITDPKKSDLNITYYIKLKELKEYADPGMEEEQQAFAGGLTYNRSQSNWSYTKKDSDLSVYSIEEGTLTVFVYNSKTGARVWKGSVKTIIDRSQKHKTLREQVEKAINKLLDRFPIKREDS